MSKIGFDATNVQPLMTLGNGAEIWAYQTTFNKKEYFRISQVYDDGSGTMLPGKGLSMPLSEKSAFMTALKKIMD